MMYLTPDDVRFLLLNGLWLAGLAICLVLLGFPAFRRRGNPLAWAVWLNVAAGAAWYGQYPAAALQERLFAAADPGHADAARPFAGRSLHIPDPDLVDRAAYDCAGVYSSGLCTLPVAHLVKTGTLDFVELGRDPVIRYEARHMDPACLDWPADPPDASIAPAFAACVLGREVPRAQADHVLTVMRRSLSWPSRMPYLRAALAETASGRVIATFDGWTGASPYLSWALPTEPRRPAGAPAMLLAIPPAPIGPPDRALQDRLLARWGLNEAFLRRAAAAPAQSLRAEAVWLACRDDLRDSLGPETRETLRAASGGLFPDAPGWRWPDDCPGWAR